MFCFYRQVGYSYSWTPGDAEWTRKSAMLTRRQSHAMFSANNKIYVMGGYTAGDLEDLSLGRSVWSLLSGLCCLDSAVCIMWPRATNHIFGGNSAANCWSWETHEASGILHADQNTWNTVISLVSIHVLAGRTTALDASRCMDTNAHKHSQPSQQKPASSQQSRTCWTFARVCEACAAIFCDCDL